MSLNTPKSSTITNPVLLDLAIQNIQQALITDLSWLDYAFHRAWMQIIDGNNAPESWQGDLEKTKSSMSIKVKMLHINFECKEEKIDLGFDTA